MFCPRGASIPSLALGLPTTVITAVRSPYCKLGYFDIDIQL